MSNNQMPMDAQSQIPDVSVIVPTLNEAQNVDPLAAELFQTFQEEGLTVEVLFADGGSTDGTQERVRAWVDRAAVRLVEARTRRGLAGDVVVAAREAKAGVVVVMDADLSHSPQAAPALARPVLDGSRDMVIGSRYVPGGTTPDWPWSRVAMSRLARLLVRPLVDVRDPTSGFFAIRRDRLLDVGDDAEGFKIGLEVLLRNDERFRVSEIPICFAGRSHGQSKMSLRQAGCYLRRVLALTGGAVTAVTAGRFALAAAAGLVLDAGIFGLLSNRGQGLAVSHILSYLAAMIVVYGLSSRWVFQTPGGTRRNPGTSLRFVTVCLMALFLRGSVLGLLTQRAGWSARPAVAVAMAAAEVVIYVGAAFFVYRRNGPTFHVLSWRLAAVGLVAYTVLLRLTYLGLPDLLPEEAYYWNYAQHPALSYLDHPPMVAWLIGLGTAAFGDTEFGVRIGAFLCWFVTAGFCFALARDLFGKVAAQMTVMLLAALPFFFVFGFFMTPDAPLTACWAGTLYFLQQALLAGRGRAWWGAGICIGLGMLSKYTIVLLGPAALLFILLDRAGRRWLLRPEPYLATLVAALLFTPVILWNSRNYWASFLFQSAGRLDRDGEFGFPTLLISIVLLITPLGVVGAWRVLFPSRAMRDVPDFNRPRASLWLFEAVFTLAPLSVFVLFSLRHEVRLSWTGPVWLAVLPAIAGSMATARPADDNRFEAGCRRPWAITLAATSLAFGGFFHYLAIGLPGVGIDNRMTLPLAWEEIGRDVQLRVESLKRELGVEPLVVGMDKYAMASELAFYRRGGAKAVEQTCGQHLFGGNALMYFFWFDPEEQAGRVLLLVGLDRKNVDRRNLPWWSRLGPIEERTIRRHGKDLRYFCRLADQYRPPPPEDRPGSFPLGKPWPSRP